MFGKKISLVLVVVTFSIGLQAKPDLEQSISFGSSFDVFVTQQQEGYFVNALVSAKSIYPNTVKLLTEDVEFISISDVGVKKWATLDIEPIVLETDNTNKTTETNFWVSCSTTDNFNLSTLLSSDEDNETLFICGTFKVLSKRRSGWAGLSGLSFEIPLSAEMCVPNNTDFAGSISVDFLPDNEGYSLKKEKK